MQISFGQPSPTKSMTQASGGEGTEANKPRKRSGSPDELEAHSRAQKPKPMTLLSSWRAVSWADRVVVIGGLGVFLWLFGVGIRRSAMWRDEWRDGRMTIEGMAPGWMFGLHEDLSDPQWKNLRQFCPILVAGLCVHISISSVMRSFEEQRPGSRAQFYAVSGIIFVLVLHGRGAIWNLLASAACFVVGKVFHRSRWNPILTWAICLWVNCAADFYNGFEATRLAPFLGGLGHTLDRQGGLYAWQIQFNLTLLRLISFNMELYWTHRRHKDGHELAPPAKTSGKASSARLHEGEALAAADFDLMSFLGYVYYIPLYIAGPICRYPQWIDQVKRPRQVITLTTFFWRFVSAAAHALAVEAILHAYVYVSINNNRTWQKIQGQVMPGWEVAFGGYLTLQFMYFKFTAIWRFFRLWSLLDGIHVPENMNRFVSLNYKFEGFWRQWHASLNQWIVRYMYLPMGGKHAQLWSMWVIFTFVGVWHDLMWRWLAWAWLNCFFFSFETAALAWGVVVHASGALNQFALIVANLAIMHGFQGSIDFLRNIFLTGSGEVSPGAWRLVVFAGLFYTMIFRVNILLRRVEAAHGIHKRY